MEKVQVSLRLNEFVQQTRPTANTLELSDFEKIKGKTFTLHNIHYEFVIQGANLQLHRKPDSGTRILIGSTTLPISINWLVIFKSDNIVFEPTNAIFTPAIYNHFSGLLAEFDPRFRFFVKHTSEPLFLWKNGNLQIACYFSEQDNFALPLILETGKVELIVGATT